MIIENCPWVKNTELINEIMQLNSKLSTHDLQLDFSTSSDDEYVTDIVISSNLDETIIVKFSMLENISRKAFNNNMTNKLRILSKKVEFIKFVIDSILKMKESDKFLSIHSFRIKFEYEPIFTIIEFGFSKDSGVYGGGSFKYYDSDKNIKFNFYTNRIDTQYYTVNISDATRDLDFEIDLDNIDGYYTLTVRGTSHREYERLTDDCMYTLVKDFITATDYLVKLQ